MQVTYDLMIEFLNYSVVNKINKYRNLASTLVVEICIKKINQALSLHSTNKYQSNMNSMLST